MEDDCNREATLFTEALQLACGERDAFLTQACRGDDALRQRVETLLRAQDEFGTFLEQPPTGLATLSPSGPVVGEQPGDTIGIYKLLQKIGEGGGGAVYLAGQEWPVRRQVALKIIKPGMDTKSVIARFEVERQALALMNHPNIAKVFDAGATPSGRPYFVMELIQGVRITEYCDRNQLSVNERLELFVKVCQALQHAHQKGIIHRDIKPSNILVTLTQAGSPAPVIIDFGIAKSRPDQRLTDQTLITVFETFIGTPAYMSPEQTDPTSVDIDTRSDIYSLGVLLYELLTGSPPFETNDLLKGGLEGVRRVIREREPMPPSTRLRRMDGPQLAKVAELRHSEPAALIRHLSGDLDLIVAKALEKDRARRYETANGLALEVQRYLANEPILARPPSTLYRFHKLVARNRLLFSGAAVIAAIVVASLVVLSIFLAKEREANRVAGAALRQSEADKRAAQIQAAKSRQIIQFLEDMLQGVGPSVARGSDTKLLREIVDKTSARISVTLTNQPAVETELRSVLGQLYLDIGNYDRAEAMYRGALAINRRLFGPESRETAATLNDLGVALWKERKLDEAGQVESDAVRIRRRLLGNDDKDVAASLNNLGLVYRREGRLPEAESTVREVLAIRERIFGGESLEVAESLHNLCVTLGDEGERGESEAIARKLLAIRRRLLPNDDPLVASAMADLSWVLGFNGKPEEAERLDEECLAIRRKILGADHPDVAKSTYDLGDRLRQRGQLAPAETLLTTALAIQRRVLGDDHTDTLDTIYRLGLTLQSEGKAAAAEKLFREGLTSWTKRSGGTAPQTLIQLDCLVTVLLGEGKLDEAGALLDAALTPALTGAPAGADLLVHRVEFLARRARWQEAAADAARVLAEKPDDYARYHALAGLLAFTDNRPAYERLCRQIIEKFGGVNDPYEAERFAQDCLLLPQTGIDLRPVQNLSATALSAGANAWGLPFFRGCEAMLSYRQGRYQEAVEQAKRSLAGNLVDAEAKAYGILAMAYFRVGQEDLAKSMLARGNALSPGYDPAKGPADLGSGWLSWISSRITLNEAAKIIAAGQTAPSLSNRAARD